jgi:23S rRNA U2552 (ribose-2'-O)-methylase RlmE/FtsJ
VLLLRRCAGGKVLDLGCVPGAWLQVACQQLGPRERGGLVLGVDIQVRQ